MLPTSPILNLNLTEETSPTRTYRAVIVGTEDSPDAVYRSRIKGYADGIEALKQAIYFILSTERYEFIIYSWDYGVELRTLFGKPIPYVKSELKRRITEALLMDDRINDVNDFKFEKQRGKLHVTFVVDSIYGGIPTDMEVEV